MAFWIINLVIFAIYTYILGYRDRSTAFIIVSVFHFMLISALRDVSVGTDTLYYARAYRYLSNHSHLYWHAMSNSKFFIAYLKVCSRFITSIYGYAIVTSIPFVVLVGFFIYKYSHNYHISFFLFVFLYFFFNSMNTARQYLAMSLVLLFFYLTDQKKYIFAFVVGLIATGIHSSALPCLVICIVVSIINWTPEKTWFSIVVIHFMNLLIPTMVNLFVILIPQYAWVKKYLFTADYLSRGRSSLVYFAYGEMALLIGLYWLYWYGKKIRIVAFGEQVVGKEDYDQHTMQIMQRMMVVLAISTMMYLFYSKVIMFNRMASNLYIFMIVYFANVLDNLKGRARLLGLFLLIPLIPFTYYQIKQGIAGITNYQFFFNSLR